jgi:hypothetical protein
VGEEGVLPHAELAADAGAARHLSRRTTDSLKPLKVSHVDAARTPRHPRMPRAPAPHPRLRRLAHGRLLRRSGASFWPGAPVLQHLLGGGATVDHIGLLDDGGDAAGGRRPARGPKGQAHVSSAGGAAVFYTSVLLMAGTNDLGQQTPASWIVQSLASLHNEAHRQGASFVAMSIPESLAASQVKRQRR